MVMYNDLYDIMGLFETKVFSEAGTTDLQKEQATYMMFKDLLEELEGMYKSKTLTSFHFVHYSSWRENRQGNREAQMNHERHKRSK